MNTQNSNSSACQRPIISPINCAPKSCTPCVMRCHCDVSCFSKHTTTILRPEHSKIIMHWPGIEPGPPAWQASILPLNHQCFDKTTAFNSRLLTFAALFRKSHACELQYSRFIKHVMCARLLTRIMQTNVYFIGKSYHNSTTTVVSARACTARYLSTCTCT